MGLAQVAQGARASTFAAVVTFLLALVLLLATPDTLGDSERQRMLDAAVEAYAAPIDPAFATATTTTEWVDVNGDSRPDALVYLEGTAWCGSGGCTLLVMEAIAPEDVAELGWFRPAAEISLVHAPVLVTEATNEGWSDLVVETGAGERYRLSFDGETYPLSPADGTPESPGSVAGHVAFGL